MSEGGRLYRVHEHGDLEAPVVVLGIEWWIDAGLGAGTAVAHLLGAIATEPLASFDGDQLIDFRARRPTVRISDGVSSALSWPEIELRRGKDPTGQDVLVLVGPEPDMRWRAFVESVVDLAADLGTRMVVALGAFPAPVPHTRPVRLAATATSKELAEQVGVVPGTIEVPAGVHAALQEGFGTADVAALGLWARVPHYVAALPYPAASAALVDGLARVTGLQVEASELWSAASMTSGRIDDLIAGSDEHAEMVRRLEAAVDAEEQPSIDLSDLPSGDELAAELERFLRGES